MFNNRKLEIKLVKDPNPTNMVEVPPIDLDAYSDIFREAVKIVVVGSILTVAFGFTARTISEVLIAKLT